MRTTLIIDDELLKRASDLTGIKQKTALVRAGLEALISRASSRRLAELGGTEKQLEPIPRRRPGGRASSSVARRGSRAKPTRKRRT